MLFFEVRSAAEVRRLLERRPPRPGTETVPLVAAVGRVLARDVCASEALPEFRRAVVDGYAVRATDTFGASAALPACLRVVGEVAMGRPAPGPLGPGEAMRIPTGGALPEGADAVVMFEYTEPVGEELVEIVRPVAPGEGLVEVGDDARPGEVLVSGGRRLRPQEIGALAAAGVLAVEVYRRPRVAVVPTGDEVVPPQRRPGPGQVRDVNTSALSAALVAVGAEPEPYPIVPDEAEALRCALSDALAACDLVLVAGGSSVGTRDRTLEVLRSLPGAALLVHGVAARPGKPLIVVAVGEKLVVGLPGHPVSALVSFEQFLRDYVRRLAGEERLLPDTPRLRARLVRSVASDPGKEDHVRVRLSEDERGWTAEPLLGKSALIRPLVEADGILTIPEGVEGLEAGAEVEVRLF